MDGIKVRRLDPDDWMIERELRLAALTDAPFAFGTTLADTVPYGEADWRDRMIRQIRFAAFFDGRPAGTSGWSPARAPYPVGESLLVGMWVAPWVRGRGVGDALVDAVTADVDRAARSRIRLSVTPGNAHAMRLYARHGFSVVPVADRIETDMIEMIRSWPYTSSGSASPAAV